MLTHDSDENLLRRAREGDDEAFAALFSRYAAPVLSYLNRLAGDRQLAENLCQETFLRLYERRRQYRFPAPVRPYLYTIARNILRNHIARRAPETPRGQALDEAPEAAATGLGPLEVAARQDDLEQLERAIRSLSADAREILVLRHFQGLRYDEIAQILDQPEGTLRSRHARALATLGGLLNS